MVLLAWKQISRNPQMAKIGETVDTKKFRNKTAKPVNYFAGCFWQFAQPTEVQVSLAALFRSVDGE